MKKQMYESPTTEVVELRFESVLCESIPASGDGGFNGGPGYEDLS